MTDAELMADTQTGDRDAFARLVERHADALVSYLARLTGSPEAAEDLAQDSFLRLYRTADRYREEGHFQAYLYRIATNLARSERRRRLRWRALHPLLAASTPERLEPGASRRLLGREMGEALERALAALSPKLRAPILLHEIEGLPVADVARALGCRPGTVKSRLHRARKRLERSLAPIRTPTRTDQVSLTPAASRPAEDVR
jgi:RNA polymerase sigma-70 factor (ECF subfamily)